MPQLFLQTDPIPKRSQIRVSGISRSSLPFVLGLINISHYLYLLTSGFYAKPFPCKRSSGQLSPEASPVQRWDLGLPATPLKPFLGSSNGTVWGHMSWLILLLSPKTDSCPGQRSKLSSCLIFCRAGWSCSLAQVLVWPMCCLELIFSGLWVWFVLGIPCPC